MKKEDFKVVIDCPLCEANELQVVKDEHRDLMQCISCGYSTSSELKGNKETNEIYKNMDSNLKKWAKEKDNQIWLPSVLNLEIGIFYPVEGKSQQMIWAFAPLVEIPEDEQKNYPNPEGGYYKNRYDTDKEVTFDEFSKGLLEINMIIEARKKLKKQSGIKLPKLKKAK